MTQMMNKDRFWEIIQEQRDAFGFDDNAFLAGIQKTLRTLSPDDLFHYQAIFEVYHQAAYLPGLWEAADLLEGGCTDDGFLDFRSWLISQGKDRYLGVLADPDSLLDHPLPPFVSFWDTPDFCELELFAYQAYYAYGAIMETNDVYVFDTNAHPLPRSEIQDILADIHFDPKMLEQHCGLDLAFLFPKLTKRCYSLGYGIPAFSCWSNRYPAKHWGYHPPRRSKTRPDKPSKTPSQER